MHTTSPMNQTYRKRFLSSPVQMLRYLNRLLVAIWKLKFSAGESKISSAFSERLSLAVTGVNDCVYCTYLHTKKALEAGVTGEQAAAILAGEIEGMPEDEARAIAFAKYWADSGGWEDTDEYAALVETYGREKAQVILATVQIVYTGNMCSNTVEAYGKKVDTGNHFMFFLAKTLAYPIAFAVKKLGGYREK